MAIRKFSVGPLRGLKRAEANDLGNLVVLAGPNGSGKSTLLDLLRQQRHQLAEPGTTVMFVGPHRTWRSSSLNRVSLFGYPMASYGALLESDSLPNFQYMVPSGMQGLQGAHRDLGSADDAPAFVKTSLGRLRDRQQALVTATWEANGGHVPQGAVPTVLEPFERLIRTLLPHLSFIGVDDDNPNDIRVNFCPAGLDTPIFDIDQLSSGEKAAIALLLPLVERQSEQLTGAAVTPAGIVPLTMLLDEPEIHLHPLLQLQVLQYLRDLASEGTAQFILSTHSTTLLDALDDDELYLLSPASLSPDNQLNRLTTSQERLEVAREITGSTHLLTRAKPIVFVEGEEERPGVSSDVRVMTNLLPSTRSWALVPGRSKREVISSVGRLRQEGLELPGTPVFGLVDADRDGPSAAEHVVVWPVAMVENLLLDAVAIFAALSAFGAQTAAVSVEAVQRVLDAAAANRVDDEVRLRVQRQLPIGRLSIRPDETGKVEDIGQAGLDRWIEQLRRLDLDSLNEEAKAEVQNIVSTGRQLDRFHGKKILRAAYDELHVNDAGIGHSAFALLVATQEAAKVRAATLAESSLARIRLFLPAGLVDKLGEIERAGFGTNGIIDRCREEYENWLAGSPTASDRTELREQLFSFARSTESERRQELVVLASQIGTTA